MFVARAAHNGARLRASYLEIFNYVRRSQMTPTPASYVRIASSSRALHGASCLRQQAESSKQPSNTAQLLDNYKKTGMSKYLNASSLQCVILEPSPLIAMLQQLNSLLLRATSVSS
jgi:hypothetical protein